jgi:hypothetical protein
MTMKCMQMWYQYLICYFGTARICTKEVDDFKEITMNVLRDKKHDSVESSPVDVRRRFRLLNVSHSPPKLKPEVPGAQPAQGCHLSVRSGRPAQPC